MSNEIVKKVTFGDDARNQILEGVRQLAEAVTSTLGPSGMRVLLEDKSGNPVITKDGVSVAEQITLLDPIQNLGATLVKQAARKTVQKAGDGTTTATALAYAILKQYTELAQSGEYTTRQLLDSISRCEALVVEYLQEHTMPLENDKVLDSVATISANNDPLLGKIIADAFKAVGKTGVVALELSEDETTTFEISDGAILDSGLVRSTFITNGVNKTCELEEPYVLLMNSKIKDIQQLIPVLETVTQAKASLLIIGDADEEVINLLAINKVKAGLRVNIIDAPAQGPFRQEKMEEIAAITGATIVDEKLGDDAELIDLDFLGRCEKSTTSNGETLIKLTEEAESEVNSLVEAAEAKLRDTKNPIQVVRLEEKIATLRGKAATVKVGAPSEIERKETFDRVEDAICAVKAAVKGGILPGGGSALFTAAQTMVVYDDTDLAFIKAIVYPFYKILINAGIEPREEGVYFGNGYNAVTGEAVLDMVGAGIIDPADVTIYALKNACSVASTLLSTNCVINNLRIQDYEDTRG